jgi:hypothetical protein
MALARAMPGWPAVGGQRQQALPRARVRRGRRRAAPGRTAGTGCAGRGAIRRCAPAAQSGVSVVVAGVAGIRGADGRRGERLGDAEAVVAARVDDHVGALRHVARGAFGTLGVHGVVVVLGRVELGRLVALEADAVLLEAELEAVRLVAVAAGDALVEHAALEERAVLVYLVADLAVGEVEALVEVDDAVAVADRVAGDGARRQRPAARMADRAGLDLPGRRTRRLAAAVAGRGVEDPRRALSLVEGHDQPDVRHRLPAGVTSRPRRHGPSPGRGSSRRRR